MKLIRPAALTVAALAAVSAFALAQEPASKPDGQPPSKAAQPEKTGAAGMSDEEMMKCMMEAAQTGPNHELLTRSAGAYTVKSSMWMGDGGEPMTCEAKATIATTMDGKFTRWDTIGEIPGMGEMKGSGTYGYDNVAKQFQACWITNCGTGMMFGTGQASDDGKTLTWTYTYHCPVQKKPIKMKDVEKHVNADTITVVTFGPDPKTGKEYKMMEMTMTRTAKADAK